MNLLLIFRIFLECVFYQKSCHFFGYNSIEKYTELRSSLTPVLPRLVEKFNYGLGVDVNCYTGETTFNLQNIFPDLNIIGIDKNHTAIDLARERYIGPSFKIADIESERNSMIDGVQVIQISTYDNLYKILSKTYPFLDEEGMMILHYKESDKELIRELCNGTDNIPLVSVKVFFLSNMYLWEHEKTVILFK